MVPLSHGSDSEQEQGDPDVQPEDEEFAKNSNYNHGPDDLCYTLVFFSTFEVLDLRIKGPMEDAGVVKLYEPSSTPCL